jgi:hypothetical protein
MLNLSKIRNRVAIGLTALALGASIFPATAAAYSPSSTNSVPNITISPTISPALTVSVSNPTAPVGPITVNYAAIAQINFAALNSGGTIIQAPVAKVCQQTADSCGGS